MATGDEIGTEQPALLLPAVLEYVVQQKQLSQQQSTKHTSVANGVTIMAEDVTWCSHLYLRPLLGFLTCSWGSHNPSISKAAAQALLLHAAPVTIHLLKAHRLSDSAAAKLVRQLVPEGGWSIGHGKQQWQHTAAYVGVQAAVAGHLLQQVQLQNLLTAKFCTCADTFAATLASVSHGVPLHNYPADTAVLLCHI